MAVGPEAGLRPYAILVDHAQRADAHVGGVVVVAEGEAVPGVEPAELGVEALGGGNDIDHVDDDIQD